MFWIILMIIGVIALFIIGAVKVVSTDPEIKRLGGILLGVTVLGMFLVTVLMSMTIVSSRSLSIVTSFGGYSNTIKPGLNWTPPWADKESYPTTNQPLDLDDTDDSKGNAVYVTFSAPKNPDNQSAISTAGGGRGNISAQITWRISDETGDAGAKALWAKYISFERVSNELVKAKAQDTLGDIANNKPAFEATVQYSDIANETKAQLGAILKPYGIVVDSVSIKRIDLDAQTQASLQKIVDAINTTAAYAEQKKGSDIQNQILKDRAAAGALEEKANVRYCLDIVNSWDTAKNGALPATFNCGLGAEANVLVGAK